MPSKKKFKLPMWFLRYSLLSKRWSEKVCHKRASVFQGSKNFIFTLCCIRFSPQSKNEIGTKYFKNFFEKNLCKLAQDECYSDEVTKKCKELERFITVANTEAATRGVLCKKVFLEISQKP